MTRKTKFRIFDIVATAVSAAMIIIPMALMLRMVP